MDVEQIKALETRLAYNCLYSLLVSKGVITKDEYVEHLKILNAVTVQSIAHLDDSEEVVELINEIYINIANSAQ